MAVIAACSPDRSQCMHFVGQSDSLTANTQGRAQGRRPGVGWWPQFLTSRDWKAGSREAHRRQVAQRTGRAVSEDGVGRRRPPGAAGSVSNRRRIRRRQRVRLQPVFG